MKLSLKTLKILNDSFESTIIITAPHQTGIALSSAEELSKQGKRLNLEVSEARESRSINANAYCWKLIGEIGKVLRSEDAKKSDDDIYRGYIREAGQSYVVALNEKAVEGFKRGWLDAKRVGNMIDDLGEYTVNGVKGRNLRVFEGSSTYDKKAMSRLLDAIVTDAQALGIQTLTPAEIEGLKSRWER